MPGHDAHSQRLDLARMAEELASENASFDVKKGKVVSWEGLSAAVGAIKAIYGENALNNPASLGTDPRYRKILQSFNSAVGAGYELFRPLSEGKKLQTSEAAYDLARSLASIGATKELVLLFTPDGADTRVGVQTVRDMVTALEKTHIAEMINGQEISVPAQFAANAEAWKAFVHLVGRLPNAGWMGAIFARTDHQENVSRVPGEHKLPTTKSNVGEFDKMVATKIAEMGIEGAVDHVWYDVEEVKNMLTMVAEQTVLDEYVEEKMAEAYTDSDTATMKARLHHIASIVRL